jgi:hypothetical protein
MWIVTARKNGQIAALSTGNVQQALRHLWGLAQQGCNVKLRREPACGTHSNAN